MLQPASQKQPVGHAPDQAADPVIKKEAEGLHAQQATMEQNYKQEQQVSGTESALDEDLNN